MAVILKIKMKNRTLLAASLLFLLLGLSAVQSGELSGTRPNIVLVMTADQGYGIMVRHGHPWIRTPHRSLALEIPKAFAMAASQAAASGRATPSLRPQLDISSLMERSFKPNTNPSRLTYSVGQFE